MADRDLDTFTQAYAECALWSSHDNSDDAGGEPFDADYAISDISDEAIEVMRRECGEFQADNTNDLAAVSAVCDTSRAGHDFWLTRNRHGSGFWDEYFGEDVALRAAFKRLTDAAHAYGSCDLCVGAGFKVYVQ